MFKLPPPTLALATREAAELLGIKPATLLALVKAGRIRAVPIGTGSRPRQIFAVSELERFLRGETETGK